MIKLLMLFCIGFNGLTATAYAEYQSAEYVRYVNEITTSFAKQMQKEFGVYCSGNSGQMPYDVEYVGMSFDAYRRATVEEARALEVIITEKFVNCINNHEKLRPFLREFPFPAKRTEISIAFYKSSGNRYADGSISRISHIDDLTYSVNDASGKSSTLFEEPYDAAVEIVKASGISESFFTKRQPLNFLKKLIGILGL